MKSAAELRALIEPARESFAFTEYDARCVLLFAAIQGALHDETLSDLLADLTLGLTAGMLAAMLHEAEAHRRCYPHLHVGADPLGEAVVRVSPWIPGPRRRAVALWLREQD